MLLKNESIYLWVNILYFYFSHIVALYTKISAILVKEPSALHTVDSIKVFCSFTYEFHIK